MYSPLILTTDHLYEVKRFYILDYSLQIPEVSEYGIRSLV